MHSSQKQFTELLGRWQAGDRGALDRLIPRVHKELHRLAKLHMRGEREGHTLQPTGLINEAYLRLVGLADVEWRGRTHFLAVAAGVMRRILVDHARKRGAVKRGGKLEKTLYNEGNLLAPERSHEFLALDEALTRLGEMDPRQAQVVELRYFAGLTVEETADVLGVSQKTVKRDWAVARAWLRAELREA